MGGGWRIFLSFFGEKPSIILYFFIYFQLKMNRLSRHVNAKVKAKEKLHKILREEDEKLREAKEQDIQNKLSFFFAITIHFK